MAMEPDLMMAFVSASDAAKWKYVKTTCPLRIRDHSGSIGSFTFMIISAFAQTASAEGAISAPAAR